MSVRGPDPSRLPRRRGSVAAVLLVVFVAVPLLELYVLIQVGQVIGAWPTIGLLLASAVLGGWLVRREGGRAWTALTRALESGRMPTRELADAGLVLLGGSLMIAPGFVTDVLGLLVVLPVTRPVARSLLAGLVARRLVGGTRPQRAGQAEPRRGGDVVEGEVVDDPPPHEPPGETR